MSGSILVPRLATPKFIAVLSQVPAGTNGTFLRATKNGTIYNLSFANISNLHVVCPAYVPLLIS